jgi:hypothetical protein
MANRRLELMLQQQPLSATRPSRMRLQLTFEKLTMVMVMLVTTTHSTLTDDSTVPAAVTVRDTVTSLTQRLLADSQRQHAYALRQGKSASWQLDS